MCQWDNFNGSAGVLSSPYKRSRARPSLHPQFVHDWNWGESTLRQRLNEHIQAWDVLSWMKCLVLIGDFCRMERNEGREFSPRLLSPLSISLLSLESEGKVRKRYRVVVQSLH